MPAIHLAGWLLGCPAGLLAGQLAADGQLAARPPSTPRRRSPHLSVARNRRAGQWCSQQLLFICMHASGLAGWRAGGQTRVRIYRALVPKHSARLFTLAYPGADSDIRPLGRQQAARVFVLSCFAVNLFKLAHFGARAAAEQLARSLANSRSLEHHHPPDVCSEAQLRAGQPEELAC